MVFVIHKHVHVSKVLFWSLPEEKYTVQFDDGVIHCVKRSLVKSIPEGTEGQVKQVTISVVLVD